MKTLAHALAAAGRITKKQVETVDDEDLTERADMLSWLPPALREYATPFWDALPIEEIRVARRRIAVAPSLSKLQVAAIEVARLSRLVGT